MGRSVKVWRRGVAWGGGGLGRGKKRRQNTKRKNPPAATNKWACRKCVGNIGVELDLILDGCGSLIIPEDEDFTKCFGRQDSRKTHINRAVRECPHKALSIGD